MQLKVCVHNAVAADPRLQRLIGRDLTSELDWAEVSEDASAGVLSAGEAALVQCLSVLAGAGVEHFDKHFDRMDGRDQAIIRGIITAAADETAQSEAAALEILRGRERQ